MKDYIEERVLELAHYIINTNSTVRSTAKKFRVSKSTVHKDVTAGNQSRACCRSQGSPGKQQGRASFEGRHGDERKIQIRKRKINGPRPFFVCKSARAAI